MAETTLTWLGHSAFRVDTADGKRIYVDPFLNGNPKCPQDEQTPERVDLIGITHAHGDHVGDTVALVGKHGSTVVAQVELASWLGKQGVDEGKLVAPNKGGTVDVGGTKFTLTHAFHSASAPDGSYGGEACGIVITTSDGKKLYFAGDTCVFGDMQLIGRIYQPDVAILPIGDYYAMGPREAAVAVELLDVKRVVPCHWGTFPALTGTPEALEKLTPSGVTIEKVEPGDTVTL
jgi:L-ascorbate metabolism protein UlaG (beta-lactamase superfamily)